MQIHTYTLPSPATYAEIIVPNAVAHYGINGVLARDVRKNKPIRRSRVQIGWEGLTVAERTSVVSVYKYMLVAASVTYIDPLGGSHSARLPTKERVYREVAYDGMKENGVISAQFDVTIALEIW